MAEKKRGRPALTPEEKAARQAAKAAGAEPKAIRRERDSIGALSNAARGFCATLHDHAGVKDVFTVKDLEGLKTVRDCMVMAAIEANNLLAHLSPVIERLTRELELIETAQAQAAEIETLKSELARANEALRVSGHGDKVGDPIAPASGGRKPRSPRLAAVDNQAVA